MRAPIVKALIEKSPPKPTPVAAASPPAAVSPAASPTPTFNGLPPVIPAPIVPSNKLSYAGALLKGHNKKVEEKIKPARVLTNGTYNNNHVKEEHPKKNTAIYRLMENYVPGFATPSLIPRGLINNNNCCYINATLQAIMVCPQLYDLLQRASKFNDEITSLPILKALIKFLIEFDAVNDEEFKETARRKPFEATSVGKVLRILQARFAQGQQEDAEEFLNHLLAGLGEELANYFHGPPNNAKEKTEAEDEWQLVSAKKKTHNRIAKTFTSPVEAIFQGLVKRVICDGGESRGLVEPFMFIQLEIQNESINTLEDALRQLIKTEVLTEYKTKSNRDASSYYTIERTPDNFVICLKRFLYTQEVTKKLCKEIKFPIDLEIPKEILSPERNFRPKDVEYKLMSLIYHEGLEASKGHYIADVFNQQSGNWIRCNDTSINVIKTETILDYKPPRVPYVFLYTKKHLLAQGQL